MVEEKLSSGLLKFIFYFLKPYKKAAFAFLSLSILSGFWGPINSFLVKIVLNNLPNINDNTYSVVIPSIFIVLNFLLFDNVTWRIIGYINFKYVPDIRNKIIEKMLEKILNCSYQFFQDGTSGRLANLIHVLAERISYLLSFQTVSIIKSVSTTIITLILAASVNQIFFYILLIWIVCFVGFSFNTSRYWVKYSSRTAASDNAINGELVDSIYNHNNVRMFARTKLETSRLSEYFENFKYCYQKQYKFINIVYVVQGLFIAILISSSVYNLINLYEKNLITLGDFALIFIITLEISSVIWYAMYCFDQFNESIGKCKQSLDVLIKKTEYLQEFDSKELKVEKGEICFNQVKFNYKQSEILFNNKNITLRAGEKVGLVGYSGSGKSSFVNLILRLYDVCEGNILIDGQDIKNVSQESLRKNIAIIPQDTTLFNRSIMENIRYSMIEASDDEVIEASKKSNIHDFISKLPLGYATIVGERGTKISGGQKQRIAIARAILKNAPILILDEATSNLDSITEKELQESLKELMHQKTSIVIAHRLSTLLYMDRILVFDQGKIIEDGTHSELILKNGLYKTLWDSQISGILPMEKQN